jgi:hypothetical protein
MTLAVEANGLDVAAIHPSKSAKYSPNLHKWLTMRSRKHHAWTSRVFSDRAGALWIGMLDNGDLFGARLMQVLCNGTKAEHACWVGLGPLVEIADFWPRYTAVGRCAIDPAHKMHFVGDDARWRTNGEHRECLWCGKHSQKLRLWVEPVERSAWEPVTANAEITGSPKASPG